MKAFFFKTSQVSTWKRRRMSFSFLSLLLLFQSTNNAAAFSTSPFLTMKSRRIMQRYAKDEQTNGNQKRAAKINGESSQKQQQQQQQQQQPVRRRRSTNQIDFPPFASAATTSANSSPSRSKRKNKEVEDVTVFFREPNGLERKYRSRTRRISVPQKVDPRLTFAQRFICFMFGLSFEPMIFSSIETAAGQTRLLEGRSYARLEPFVAENITVPPSLADLSSPSRKPFDGFWVSTPARLLSFGIAYYSFPYFIKALDTLVTMPVAQLDDITSKFGPGIAILYGTFISLTLSILYTRQRNIQDNVALECSLLVSVTRNLLSIFKHNKDKAIEAGQCAADQIRTLVRSSRGAELMLLMYSDPYARMLELIDQEEEDIFKRNGGPDWRGTLFGSARETLKDLTKTRSKRLSDEGLALPPTHFLVLNILTLLILFGYTANTVPTVNPISGLPSNESSLLFGVLSSTYILFYNFATDLNNPFAGVYQVRRSTAAAHLLEAKWLIANHPLLRGEVDFESPAENGSETNGVLIKSPFLGELWFERDEIYIDRTQTKDVDEM